MDVTYFRYSPKTSDSRVTGQLIECYRDVFADGPWHEWLKCPNCGEYWGKKDVGLLAAAGYTHCGSPLVDFYERGQLLKERHLIGPEASAWVAMVGSRVVGFCWGYPATRAQLEAKLGVPVAIGDEKVAYQNEVGVLVEFRDRKVAKELVKLRLQDFLAQGLRYGVVRVREAPEPSKTFLWYQKLGYQRIATYPEGDGRVILGRNLEDLPEIL